LEKTEEIRTEREEIEFTAGSDSGGRRNFFPFRQERKGKLFEKGEGKTRGPTPDHKRLGLRQQKGNKRKRLWVGNGSSETGMTKEGGGGPREKKGEGEDT